MKSLTLRRVPPNLLVAQGATEFAIEMGMPVLPYDALISPAAQDRWIRWRSDLKAAERKSKKAGNHPSCWKIKDCMVLEDEFVHQKMRQQHTNNLLQAYPALLRSPELSDDMLYYASEDDTSSTPSDPSMPLSGHSSVSWPIDEHAASSATSVQALPVNMEVPHIVAESSRSAFVNSTQKVPTIGQLKDYEATQGSALDRNMEDAQPPDTLHGPTHTGSTRKSWGDGSGGDSDIPSSSETLKADPFDEAPAATTWTPLSIALEPEIATMSSPQEKRTLDDAGENSRLQQKAAGPLPFNPVVEDHITDTVGAIAVDSWGNIACGASSGGIGMKYRGRVGPAALVGVGAAVIPVDPDDSEQTCVATVTSGTGEHMATTMAATACAERLYQSVKKSRGGEYVEVTEDEALRAMIENEFMGESEMLPLKSTLANLCQVIQVSSTATLPVQLAS